MALYHSLWEVVSIPLTHEQVVFCQISVSLQVENSHGCQYDFYKCKGLKSDTPSHLPTVPKYHVSKILLLRPEFPLHAKFKD